MATTEPEVQPKDVAESAPGDPRAVRYPAAPRSDVIDDYFGTPVADPFRPLEQHDLESTRAWVQEENALTRRLLDSPMRARIHRRLRELFDFERISALEKKRNRYFYAKNEGLRNQPVYYMQEGSGGKASVVLDPNELAVDGTVAVKQFSPSDDASLVAYTVSRNGSDWEEIRIRDLAGGNDLRDRLHWVKFTEISWTPDGRGFYYNRYPMPGSVPPGDEHYFPRTMYHVLGTSQEEDLEVYERPGERDVAFGAKLAGDGRYLIVTANRGGSDRSEVWIQDRSKATGFRPMFTGFDHDYDPIGVIGGELFIRTNEGAPRRRLIAVELDTGARREVIPEAEATMESAHLAFGAVLVHYLENASSLLKVFALDGSPARSIELPGLGSVTELRADVDEPEVFIAYSTYLKPPANHVYRVDSGELRLFGRTSPPFDPDDYITEQVWYPSKDGTMISMFLSHRKDLRKDSNTPVFLYGYGGFNIAMTPSFNPVHFYFMEQGGIFAVANLRGGAEFGEDWHRAGMLENKQNVFDDFAAAAEWLIREGYTSTPRLTISGRSNGGLLAAVSLVQHPELFGAVVVQVPVIDMLRYHRFTVARFWIPEYGSSEERRQFGFLYAYSPLHHLSKGSRYPPTLITTADTDDRVDPGQAKKFAAALQEAQGGDAPILIRIDTKAGHASGSLGGAGKPVSKLIDEWADIWTFVFFQVGVNPS